jgi:glycosyltransferase involved in cell wall biosynthesis
MSRIDSGKGVDIFADSLQYLTADEKEKLEFWMMGEPTVKGIDKNGRIIYEEQAQKLHSKLKEIAKDNPELFKLIPFRKDYISYLNGMDVFVLPTHNEMYSLSVIDAMMMGLPVIGTDAGGTTEQIGNNERGILVTPGSAKSIADAVGLLLNDPEQTKLKGENAREWALSQHNFINTVERVLEYLST